MAEGKRLDEIRYRWKKWDDPRVRKDGAALARHAEIGYLLARVERLEAALRKAHVALKDYVNPEQQEAYIEAGNALEESDGE